jgi:hypothetical protein
MAEGWSAIMTGVAMALGLSGGVVAGLSLRGVIAAARAGATMIAAPLVMLVATVVLSCGVAWTFFGEYVGRGGWLWFSDGLLAGLALGELAFLLGQQRRSKARPPGTA